MTDKVQIEIQYLDSYKKEWGLLEYAHEGDAGFDIRASNTSEDWLGANSGTCVPTGIKVAVPEGYELQIRSRSGMAYNHSIFVLNSPGTIDSGYRGEVGVILFNLSKTPFVIVPGMRIAQGVVSKLPSVELKKVDKLSDTKRGSGGFGSTGVK